MSKLFGKILSKKVKAIIISCFVGLAVAAGAIATAVLVNNRGVSGGELADTVVDSTPTTDVTIGAGDNKSVKWSQAVITSQREAIPVKVTLTENWTATLNSRGTYKIFGDQTLTGFDARGALEIPAGAEIILDLGGHILDRALVNEQDQMANRAVIAGSAIINRGTLTISNGTVQHGYSSTNGGGIYSYGNLTLGNNLTVRANYADFNGGGIYCERNLTINGPVTFDGNYANRMNNDFTGKGGAIYANGGIVSIDKLTAKNGQAAMGGAIAFEGSTSFAIRNSTFENNTAYADNQTDYTPDGGAIYVGETYRVNAVNVIENSNIGTSGNGNVAYRHGGGMAYYGKNDLNIDQTNISYNTANLVLYGKVGMGGAVYKNTTATLNIRGANGAGAAKNYFTKNSALSGGALATMNGVTNITGNMSFTENKFGGVFFSSSESVNGYGGHIYNDGILNIGTPIVQGQTHPANDLQPYFGQNGFNDNVTYNAFGGAIHCGKSAMSSGQYTKICEMNLYGGTIDQCKAVRYGGAINCSVGSHNYGGKTYSLAPNVNMYDFTITRSACVTANDQGTRFDTYSYEAEAICDGNWNIYGGKITNCGDKSLTGIQNARASYYYDCGVIYTVSSYSTVNIYKCEISGNNTRNIFSGSGSINVGEKDDTSADAQSKVIIKNNTAADYIFRMATNVYNCTVDGNTASIGLAGYTSATIYSGCKLVNSSKISKLYAGTYRGINFKEWLNGTGVNTSILFAQNIALYDCVISGMSGSNLLYQSTSDSANVTLKNTVITGNTYSDTIFYTIYTNTTHYIYLNGDVSITNNTLGSGVTGITRVKNSTQSWQYNIQGGNNVISGNKNSSGGNANIAFYNSTYGSYGIYVNNTLSYGNNLYVSQPITRYTTTNYKYYATIDGRVLDPDTFIHFENTSYHAYYTDDNRLYFGTSKPAVDNGVDVPTSRSRTASVSFDSKNNYFKFNATDIAYFDTKTTRISKVNFTPYNVANETYGTQISNITDFNNDGFLKISPLSYNTYAYLYAWQPGYYDIFFETINGTFKGGSTSTFITSTVSKSSVASYSKSSSSTEATYVSATYVAGRTLSSITTTYGTTTTTKKVQYYKDSARTQEIPASTIAEYGTYYVKITPNYTNYNVYTNKDGKGWTTVNASYGFYWFPTTQNSSYNPWNTEIRISQAAFTNCTFNMPDNTIITSGSKATPTDTIEVWEGSGSTLRRLEYNTDYTIEFSDNGAAGMGTALIKPAANRNYKNNVTKQFKISVSDTPIITGEPEVSTVTKAYDATDVYPGTISRGTLKLADKDSNVVFDDEALTISSMSAKFSQSDIGECELIVTMTFTGNYQQKYNVAEFRFSTIGGEQVRIIGRDISDFRIDFDYWSADGNEHIYKPDIGFNNGTKWIYLREGIDFEYQYYRNGVKTTDFISNGLIEVWAVGIGDYTGIAKGTYGIGNEYYHDPYMDYDYDEDYVWEGGVYQAINLCDELTDPSYHRLWIDIHIDEWGTGIGGPKPKVISYFSFTSFNDYRVGNTYNWDKWVSDVGLPHVEIYEPGDYTIYWYAYAQTSDWFDYEWGSWGIYFQKDKVDVPITNSTHTFDYDGANHKFVESYDNKKMSLKVVHTDPLGRVTEYLGSNAVNSYKEAGTYKVIFTTDSLYEFNSVSSGLSNSSTVYTVNYEIKARKLNDIAFTGGNNFTYNAQAQGPQITTSLSGTGGVLSGQTVYLGVLYTGTDKAGKSYSSNVKPTNAGTYTLTITGIFSDSGCNTPNANYYFTSADTYNFEIKQAAITVNAPKISDGQTVYVGWNLSDITLADVKVTFGGGNVPGHWVWVEPNTKIMMSAGTVLTPQHTFTATYAVKFILDEETATNFVATDAVNKTITITVNSLYVHVVEHLSDEYGNLLDEASGGLRAFDIFVDYNATFNLDTYLASTERSAQHGMVAALYYKNNEPLTSIENIISNKENDDEVHVKFTKATDTVYYQLHIREHQDGTYSDVENIKNILNTNNYVFDSYPAAGKIAITAQNVAAVNKLLADSTTLDCLIEVKTGTTGDNVVCAAVADTSYSAGYNIGDGTNGKISGNGTTIVTRTYALKTYKLGFDANGGNIAVGTPQYDIKRNAHITSDILPENKGYTPTKTGYKLLGWAMDKTATEPMDISEFVMPAANTTLYAVWGPVEYYIIFNYTDYTKVDGETKLTDLSDNYFADLTEDQRAQYTSTPYTVLNNFAPVVNSLQLTEKPKYVGLTFKRWVYYVGGVATSINSLTVTTLGKADVNDSNQAIYIYAEWEPATYTLSFNSNGTILQTRVNVTNFTKYDTYTYPAATSRVGYTFDGWYTADNKSGNFVVTGSEYEIDTVNGATPVEYVALLGNTTLYAGWTANEYDIDITGVDQHLGIEILVNGVVWTNGKVFTGDILTITITPGPGYAADEIYVSGRICSSGMYTVLSSYEDKKIVITCDAIEKVYTITYKLNGGAWASGASESAPKNFTVKNADNPAISDIIALPDKTKLTRTGYVFAGWYFTDSDGNLIGNAKEYVSDFFNPISNIANVQLTAKWAAESKVIMVYKNAETIDMEWNNENATATTGEVLELKIPIPDSYKLVGLATTATGRVEYPAFEKDGEDGNFMYVNYIVKAGENELFCKWIGSGNLFVSITQDKMNYVYSPTGELKLTALSSKRYTDTSVEAVEYAFTWLKYNGVRFVTVSTQTSSNYYSEFKIKNVSDSGLYRCELIVTVISRSEDDDYNKIIEYAQNTSPTLGVEIPIGDYDLEVTISPARLTGLNLTNETTTYTSHDLKEVMNVKYGLSLGGLNEAGTVLTLPDNSTALITYSYYASDGMQIYEIIDVGTYRVVVEFEMNGNSNYQAIDSLTATLTVTAKRITHITYKIAGLEGDVLTASYTGAAVTVVATSTDIEEKDVANVTIMLNNATGNIAVGSYVATVAGLSGSASSNYTIVLSADKAKCTYKIVAAQREFDIDFVGINAERVKEVTYNGTVFTISLADLPASVKDQVTVVYSVVYTAAYAGYTAPEGNIAENNNGGKAAGTYVVTATFLEKTGNYTAKAPISATLKIKQAAYSIDVTGKDENGDSFVDNQYVPQSDTVHRPTVVNLNADEVVASYKYEKDSSISGSTEASWVIIPTGDGLIDDGQYRLTASFAYVNDFLNNNYAPIADVVISFVIVKANLAKLEIRYTNAEQGLVGSYGGALDTNQFSVYAVYGTDDDAHEELIYTSALTFFDMSTGEAVPFTRFASVSEAYPIRITYYKQSVDCFVKVGAATYDISLSFKDVSKVYNVEGNEPTLNINYVKDVNGVDVDSVNFYYSVYNTITNTWDDYVPVGELKFYDVGAYKVKLAYKHVDTNYVGIDFTDFGSEITVTIVPKPVTEVTWQYTTDDVTWYALPEGGLTYSGLTYKFLALYNGATEDAVAEVAMTATNVKVGGYEIVAVSTDKNYALGTNNEGLKTIVMINPYEVEAKWFIEGAPVDPNERQLNYDVGGSDQFDKVSASYTNLLGQKVPLIVNRMKNRNGVELPMIDARTYTLSVSDPADINYKVTSATKEQDIILFGLDLDPTLAWFEYSTNGGNNWYKVPENGELPYVGKTYTFRVAYYLNESDKAEDLVKVSDLTVTGINVGDYKLTGGNVGSVYITNVVTAKIMPLTLTITLTNPVFDGTTKSPTVNLNGVVDGYSIEDLFTISGDLSARNVKGEGNYVMTFALNGSEATKNYKLAEASKAVEWNITPVVAEITWKNLVIEYAGVNVLPSATLTLALNDTDKVLLVLRGASMDVASGNPVKVEAITFEDGSINYNYTVVGSATAETTYDIVKATVYLSGVVYKEYPTEDQTFVGTQLRNDKLSGDAFVYANGKSVMIKGKLEFVSTEPYSKGGFFDAAIKFTPSDTRHYKIYEGTLSLLVKSKAVSGIEIDTTASLITFVNGTKIFKNSLSDNMKIYQVFNDYYYDEILGEEFGTRNLVAGGPERATFYINGSLISDTVSYTFNKPGVYEVMVELDGDIATYEITVTEYLIEKITLNKNTKPKYYVSEKFDVSTITLNVKYKDEANASVISSGISVKGRYATDAFTTTGSVEVTLEYGGVEFKITVEVLKREDLNIVFTGRDLKYTGSVISIPTATLNGVELPHNTYVDIDGDGVNDIIAIYSIYSFTPEDKGLSPFGSQAYTLLELGSYEIKVTINVVNIKYNDHDSIISTFNVVDSVIQEVYQLKLIESSKYEIIEYNGAKYLTHIVLNDTVDDLLGNFETTDGKIIVTNAKGEQITGSTVIGTGYVISVVGADGQPVEGVESVTCVLRGDVNGDGKLKTNDYTALKNHILGEKELTDAQILAGDCDGKSGLKTSDYTRLKNVVLGSATMEW